GLGEDEGFRPATLSTHSNSTIFRTCMGGGNMRKGKSPILELETDVPFDLVGEQGTHILRSISNFQEHHVVAHPATLRLPGLPLPSYLRIVDRRRRRENDSIKVLSLTSSCVPRIP